MAQLATSVGRARLRARALGDAVDWRYLGLRIGAFVGALSVVDLVLLRATRLPAAAYEAPFLMAELVGHLAAPRVETLLLAGFLLGLGGAALWRRSLGPRWADLAYGRRLRTLALVIAGVLAWSFASYSFNAYFGRFHAADRVLLVAAAGLVVWRPGFIWAFVLVLMPTVWQFHEPIGGASWAEPILLVRVLLVLGIAYLFRAVTDRVRGADVVFVVACLVAAHYFISGVGKLELDGWIPNDRLYYLLPATYANGWLGFLEPAALESLTQTLARFNGPLKAFTLLVEVGALFALVRRRALQAFLVVWIVLHGGIFLTTGICFWKWMILDAALFLLFAASARGSLPIFTRPHAWLSILLVGGGFLWFRPVKLAWHDARVSYTYRIEAETADGSRFALGPRFFEPYAYQFTLSSFGYLSRDVRLPITWGATRQQAVAEGLTEAVTPEAVWELEAAHGRVGWQPERAEQFDAFVRRFVQTRLERPDAPWWSVLQAPPQLWTFPYRPELPTGAGVRRLVVTQVTSLYDEARYREIRAVQVRVVEMSPTLPAPMP